MDWSSSMILVTKRIFVSADNSQAFSFSVFPRHYQGECVKSMKAILNSTRQCIRPDFHLFYLYILHYGDGHVILYFYWALNNFSYINFNFFIKTEVKFFMHLAIFLFLYIFHRQTNTNNLHIVVGY
jgi:hypothetical protein